jgi:glycosyltransferase involved in cell wall biosynthesis
MLSIIIPTYQEEKYLGRLLASIKMQTLQPDEIIVADNHSKDKTREIAKAYGCNIVNGGNPAEGRNAGAKIAKGNILLFLDSDTNLKNKKYLEKFVRSFKNRNLDIATSFVKYENPGVKEFIVNLSVNATKIANVLILQHLKKIVSEVGINIMMTKKFYDTIGRFDENKYIHEDTDLFVQVTQKGAKYGLVPLKIDTSERRFKKMDTQNFIRISYLAIYGFFSRFLGFEDTKKFIKKYEESYGPLGGDIDNKSQK